MTLLDDAKKIFKDWQAGVDGNKYDLYDSEIVAEALDAVVREDNMWFGDMRWGSIQGYVIGRREEFVMVKYYSYSGDADGDPDFDLYPVKPEEVTTYRWVTIV